MKWIKYQFVNVWNDFHRLKFFLSFVLIAGFIVFVFVGGVDAVSEIESVEDTRSEVIGKRTYDSRTFQNIDNTFTTEISSGDMFFFDGEQFTFLEEMSVPAIEKKEIVLDEIPDNHIFDFGTYTLHEGINAELEGYDLVFKDANDRAIKFLPRPFSTDADGDVELNEYIIDINGRDLSIFVDVDSDWLKSASYPVVIDPTANLDNSSGIYDGHVIGGGSPARVDTSTTMDVGSIVVLEVSEPLRSFIEFNTSSIDDDVTITDVDLNITSNPNMKGIPITKKEGMMFNSIIKLNYIFTISEKMIEKFLFSVSKEKRDLIKSELLKRLK